MKSPIEFAKEWYDAGEIYRSINRIRDPATGERINIPKDVSSREFAEWMAEQYQLAMAKGIQIGREQSEGRASKCAKCRGSGEVRGPSDSGYIDCPACDGRGR